MATLTTSQIKQVRDALAELSDSYVGAMASEYDFPQSTWWDRQGEAELAYVRDALDVLDRALEA